MQIGISLSIGSSALVGGLPPITQPSDLPGLFALYDGTATTVTGSGVSSWTDQVGTMHLLQATDSARPPLVASDARFNNQPSVVPDGAADFVKAATAATCKFLHDGTGCTVYIAYHCLSASGSRALIDSCGATAANVGFSLFHSATNQSVSVLVGAGGVAAVGTTASANGSAPNNASRIVSFAYGEGVSPNEWEFRVGKNATASGNSSAAPSAADPFGSLTVGRLTAGGLLLNGAIACIALYNQRHSTAQMQQFEAWASARFGV